MADIADFVWLKPTTPLTGGAIGATQILSQTATGISTLSGVTIDDANGNAEGDGTLTYNSTNQTLTWRPPSGVTGAPVDVSSDGTYAIEGGNNDGIVIATVVSANLPGSNLTNTIAIANIANGIFDDVSKDESDAGMTDYRLVYLKNNSADTKKEAKVWIKSNTPGEDTVSIGLDPAGVSASGATIADENTAPAGVTFTAPSSSTNALSIGTLTSSQYYGIWIKRLVPSGVTTTVDEDTFSLTVSAKV